MTREQSFQLKRFAWLCDELRAGNQFSDSTLLHWANQARREIERDERQPELGPRYNHKLARLDV